MSTYEHTQQTLVEFWLPSLVATNVLEKKMLLTGKHSRCRVLWRITVVEIPLEIKKIPLTSFYSSKLENLTTCATSLSSTHKDTSTWWSGSKSCSDGECLSCVSAPDWYYAEKFQTGPDPWQTWPGPSVQDIHGQLSNDWSTVVSHRDAGFFLLQSLKSGVWNSCFLNAPHSDDEPRAPDEHDAEPANDVVSAELGQPTRVERVAKPAVRPAALRARLLLAHSECHPVSTRLKQQPASSDWVNVFYG